ncbi:hypothetical protein Aperf_G00000033851 [Anoplocephala perfoliata]
MERLGSIYVGEYKNLRMEGKGKYKLLSGSIYDGEMKDGMYHGAGKITFPDGSIYCDGLSEDKWLYCDGIDRRFASEIKYGLNAPGQEKISDGPTRKIPRDFYDVGDGIYDPENRVVYDYDMRFLRNADVAEHNWAIAKGRKGWDEPTKGRPNPCRPELSDPRLNDSEWLK